MQIVTCLHITGVFGDIFVHKYTYTSDNGILSPTPLQGSCIVGELSLALHCGQ
jgi:hypothetical protein